MNHAIWYNNCLCNDDIVAATMAQSRVMQTNKFIVADNAVQVPFCSPLNFLCFFRVVNGSIADILYMF